MTDRTAQPSTSESPFNNNNNNKKVIYAPANAGKGGFRILRGGFLAVREGGGRQNGCEPALIRMDGI